MAIRCLPLMTIAGGLLVLDGCRTATTTAGASGYVPPARSTEVATILGSRRRPGFLAEDHLGFVLMVDRKIVANADKAWNQPLNLAAGKRTITAEYRNGSSSARADLELDVKPGATYHLKIVNGTEGEGRRFNDFWIVDARTGSVVTSVYHAEISGGNSNYNPFSVN
jgi:hypothetical protein